MDTGHNHRTKAMFKYYGCSEKNVLNSKLTQKSGTQYTLNNKI